MFKHYQKPFDDESIDTTAQRLLEAAGEIFADLGYRAATVRQICEKAGANVAAINYHFGDKEGLYMAVLRFVPATHEEKYPLHSGLSPDAAPEQKLRAYIQALLERIFDEGPPGWHTKIIVREMSEPTRALDTLVEEFARPLHQELSSIVRELLGSKAGDEAVCLCTLSIMSQCVYYQHARSVIRRLYPEQSYSGEDIARRADHITGFSLAAMKALAQEKKVVSQ
jgi:AcrR family transcriptional regulator